MRAYDVALFVHLLGAITLFVAFGIMQRGGVRVRRAETLDHVRLWLGLLKTTPAMFPAAFVMILVAGLYMTAEAWTFTTPWVVVALVVVAVMIVVGIGVIGRGLNRMEAAAAAVGEGSLPPELRKLIWNPVTWLSVFALNGMAIGTLWLMAAKPGWVASVAVVLGLAMVGMLVGLIIVRRESSTRERTDLSVSE